MNGQQKITFTEMRAWAVRNMLIYCADHRCGHLNIVPDDADRWPDELRICDIEGPLRVNGLRPVRRRHLVRLDNSAAARTT